MNTEQSYTDENNQVHTSQGDKKLERDIQVAQQKSQQPKNTKQDKVHSRLQLGFGVVIYSVLLGAVVAVIANFYEIGFKYLSLLWHDDSWFFQDIPIEILYALGPFVAVPILYFIIIKIPEKRPHNLADLITGIHLNNGRIDAQGSLLTVIASAFSIAFGYSVGYYAPTVQLGAGAGALFHRLKWVRPVHAYISIGAGSAAAIAAIFHSPIGAVVFVHEVLFRFFSIRAFAPVTIAAVTSYVLSSELFNRAVFFNVTFHQQVSTPTYVVAAFAGILAAIIGMMLLRFILFIQQNNKAKLGLSTSSQLLIAAGITAIIIVFVPQVAGSSPYALQSIVSGKSFALGLLLLIFMAKFMATGVAFGFGVPGGIFGPTIFIGAALGGVVAEVMVTFYPMMSDAYQIIIITTMAAMISAVLGAPIAMILIIIEITGDFNVISVVMLAVVMANITAYRFMGTSSFFDIQLKSRGFDFEAGRDRVYAEHSSIKELITDNYIAFDENTTMEDAERALLEADKFAAYVIDQDGNLLGRITLVAVEQYQRKYGDSKALLNAVMQTDPPTLYSSSSIWTAMQKMSESNKNCLPVVDGEHNPKLLGVIYTQPLMAQYFAHLRTLRDEENAIN